MHLVFEELAVQGCKWFVVSWLALLCSELEEQTHAVRLSYLVDYITLAVLCNLQRYQIDRVSNSCWLCTVGLTLLKDIGNDCNSATYPRKVLRLDL